MKKILLSVLAALALGASASASLAAAVPANGKLAFDVIRKGRDIGDYTISFRSSGQALSVRLNTNVAVKLPLIGVKVYVFKQDSQERWQGGKLAGLTSTTNDNGEKHNISLGASPLLPASLWNSDIVHAHKVVNTIDGRTMAIKVQGLGSETVKTGHGKKAATHYRISGGLARDLWYGADGTLVKVAFVGDDGSRVEYRLR